MVYVCMSFCTRKWLMSDDGPDGLTDGDDDQTRTCSLNFWANGDPNRQTKIHHAERLRQVMREIHVCMSRLYLIWSYFFSKYGLHKWLIRTVRPIYAGRTLMPSIVEYYGLMSRLFHIWSYVLSKYRLYEQWTVSRFWEVVHILDTKTVHKMLLALSPTQWTFIIFGEWRWRWRWRWRWTSLNLSNTFTTQLIWFYPRSYLPSYDVILKQVPWSSLESNPVTNRNS